jgi:hypothetical protein
MGAVYILKQRVKKKELKRRIKETQLNKSI